MTIDTGAYQAGDDIETAAGLPQEEEEAATATTVDAPNDDENPASIQTETNHTVETFLELPPDDNHDDDHDHAHNDDERTRHWKDHPYAVGLVNINWSETPSNAGRRPDCPLCFSYMCCKRAGRLGNMVVLYEKMERIGTSEIAIARPVLIVGPHWPILACITYPLILSVSMVTLVLEIQYAHPALVAVWTVLTLLLIVTLACVACRNPGIMRRYDVEPSNLSNSNNDHAAATAANNTNEWIWNDQGRTFRPRKARYDSECAVVVEDYDHTCPWTGTAIGKNNMRAFQCFVCLVGTMILFNATLLIAPI